MYKRQDEYKNDNHPATQEAWEAVKALAKKELSNKKLYVVDAFCGANPVSYTHLDVYKRQAAIATCKSQIEALQAQIDVTL